MVAGALWCGSEFAREPAQSDPQIDLDVVADEPRTGDYRYTISASFSFGGHNVAAAFGRYCGDTAALGCPRASSLQPTPNI
jgi:hypothetical protein